MNFTLNGARLKYINQECILMYRNYGNWKNKPEWCQLSIWNTTNGYKMINIFDSSYLLHRVIGYLFLGLDIDNPEQCIDHIDGDRKNNNLENLRIVNNQQNHWNMTRAKGYSWCKQMKKWRTRVGTKIIGYYENEEEARQVYLDAKKIYHVIP